MVIIEKIARAARQGGIWEIPKRAFNKLRWSFVKPDYSALLTHSLPHGTPTTSVVFQQSLPLHQEDVQIATRIITAFHKAEKDIPNKTRTDLWDLIQAERHADFYAVLDDPEAFAFYMHNMNERGITYGIGGGPTGRAALEDIKVRTSWGIMMKDIFISLAEAIGVLPYRVNKNIYLDDVEVLNKLETFLDIKLNTPQIDGGQYKYAIGDVLYDTKELWSIYTAWRIKNNQNVAEIGAGIGKTALYSRKFGVLNYWIYDLPTSNVVQAWYLIKSGVSVTLYGEEDVENSIHIMPYWVFNGTKKFNVVVNVDSFAEMDEITVKNYLKTITECADFLLSINQEDAGSYRDDLYHITLKDVAKKIPQLKRLIRIPFWLSRQYVEEYYTISK